MLFLLLFLIRFGFFSFFFCGGNENFHKVPLAEVRNDAVDNLLGALTIAAHFVIPEVGLFFNNKLFRGNRSTKIDAIDFNAFDTPNFRPLVNVGVNIGKFWRDLGKECHHA